MVGEYFQVVESSQGVLFGASDGCVEEAMPTRVASAQRQPKSRFSPPTAGAKATHQLWLSNPGMTWAQAAQARGIKPSSAMDDLVAAAIASAAGGQATDLSRLASELQIGSPGSVCSRPFLMHDIIVKMAHFVSKRVA